MDYTKLGRSGLDVSRLCLGCMSFGVPERGAHPWTLNEEIAALEEPCVPHPVVGFA